MKVDDIIKIQDALLDASDFIAHNGDGDETDSADVLINVLFESRRILQKEKERIYLKTAKQKLKIRRNESTINKPVK